MQGWKRYRPAIWLAFLAVAVVLVVNPVIGVVLLGGSIGVALRILRRTR